MGYPLLCQKQHHLGQQVGSSSRSLTVGEAYDVCKVYPQMSGTPMIFQGNIRKVSIYLSIYLSVIIYTRWWTGELSNLNTTQAFIMREIDTVPTTSSCWWSQTCFMISNICAVVPKMQFFFSDVLKPPIKQLKLTGDVQKMGHSPSSVSHSLWIAFRVGDASCLSCLSPEHLVGIVWQYTANHT